MPSELGEDNLEEPVDKGETGDEDEGGPPAPEDEEVVLVEHVVWKKTENIALVGTSPN